MDEIKTLRECRQQFINEYGDKNSSIYAYSWLSIMDTTIENFERIEKFGISLHKVIQ